MKSPEFPLKTLYLNTVDCSRVTVLIVECTMNELKGNLPFIYKKGMYVLSKDILDNL